MKAVCAEPGCPELVEDTGPEITAESYCPKHRVLYEPEPSGSDELEERIKQKLSVLESLRRDHVKYRGGDALLRHYERVVVPTLRRYVQFLRDNGEESRLLDLEALGYRVTYDNEGDVADVRIRHWGVNPEEWGP